MLIDMALLAMVILLTLVVSGLEKRVDKLEEKLEEAKKEKEKSNVTGLPKREPRRYTGLY